MSQGNYSEAQFLLPETAPPDGAIWLWVDDVRGRVKWVKLSHTAHDGDAVGHLIRQLRDFNLDLTNPTDIQSIPLDRSKQGWVIDNRTEYPDRGYTLFGVSIDISSRAVNSDDGGSFAGDGFSFSATGDAIWYASGSGTEVQPTLATGVTGSIPQGYFPKTSNYPRTQFFRSYGNSQWFTAYGTQTSNSGTITDDENAFNNAPSEVNNSNSSNENTRASANVLPFYMNASSAIIPFNEAAILDLGTPPVVTTYIAQIRFANFSNSSNSIGVSSTVNTLCGESDAVFSGNVGGGFAIDVENSNYLTLTGGVYRVTAGTPNTVTRGNEELRQIGTDNRAWSPNSLRTTGTAQNSSQVGNYMISTNPIYQGVHGGGKAIARIENNAEGTALRVTGITYCGEALQPYVIRFFGISSTFGTPLLTELAPNGATVSSYTNSSLATNLGSDNSYTNSNNTVGEFIQHVLGRNIRVNGFVNNSLTLPTNSVAYCLATIDGQNYSVRGLAGYLPGASQERQLRVQSITGIQSV